MKGRFDGLDVTAMVAYLQKSLLGRRIVNIYDGNSGESYIFKLEGDSSSSIIAANASNATTDAAATTTGKHFLLLESGIRFHTLQHYAAESPMPTPFCAKLRKHLRSLRLEQVQQIGSDRVVLLQFGSGSSKHAIILELYAKGNIILVDAEYKILALLRSHVYEKGGEDEGKGSAIAVQVGQVYPVSYATSWKKESKSCSNDESGGGDSTDSGILSMSIDQVVTLVHEQIELVASGTEKNTKKGKKGGGLTLKTLLLKPAMGVSHYGPTLLEHCILCAELKPNQSISLEPDSTTPLPSLEDWERLQKALAEQGPAVMQALQEAASVESPGYVLYRPMGDNEIKPETTNAALPHADKVLEEFQPHLLKQHEDRLFVKYDNFSAAVEDFFSHLVNQKRLQKAQAAESNAIDKLERVRTDLQDRVVALEQDQEELQEHARVVQLHADIVDKALTVINSGINSGMDWDQLEQLVEVEQTNGNPIAMLIHKLELEHDSMILRLKVDEYDEDSPILNVRISLKESAHANASALFGKYRASKEKAQKTIEASTKALKAAEESAQRQLADAQKRGKQLVTVSKRKPLWFEKFHWFITSDNYLVLGGRDAHQNEQLVKRYLRTGDAYLHADVHGASSCVLRAKRRRLKNGKTETVPLSDQALREAGNFTICNSSAWSSKMITSAWWVESHQVSKTAPTGEFLTLGSFMVRGKKTFLPPTQLEMGLAVLFRLGDDDLDGIARHNNDRRDFALMELENYDQDPDEDNDNDDGKVASDEKQEEEDSRNQEPSAVRNKTTEALTHTSSNGDEKEVIEDELRGTSHSSNKSEDDSDTGVNNRAKNDSKERKGLSVRDRKVIKKYGSLEEGERVIASSERDADTNSQERESVAPTSVSMNTAGQKKLKRGKKTKMKRAQKKYEDQDDEDFELAMLALQGGEKSKKQVGKRDQGPETETQRKVAAETTDLLVKDSSKVAAGISEEVRSILAECVTVNTNDSSEIRWEKFDADTLEQLIAVEPPEAQTAAANRLLNLKNSTRIDNFSASLGGIIRTIRKYGHKNLDKEPVDSSETTKRKTKAEKDETAVKWKQAMAEEGVVENDIDEDAIDDTVELTKLTGTPHAEDLLLYAVPVCAPYQTLSKYAYRVKLTPGNMKRGKAAKQCIGMFLTGDTAKPTPSSDLIKDLIKKVGDNDWVQVICPDVKISAAGAGKGTKKNKTNSKKASKKN